MVQKVDEVIEKLSKIVLFQKFKDSPDELKKIADILNPVYFREGEKIIINCGSVGQPRDGDPRASLAIYDDREEIIFVKRIKYPVEATQQEMAKERLPKYLSERLSYGR